MGNPIHINWWTPDFWKINSMYQDASWLSGINHDEDLLHWGGNVIIELHSSAIDPVCKKQTLPSIWVFPKMVVPPISHTKMVIFSRKTTSSLGKPTILGNPPFDAKKKNIGASNPLSFFWASSSARPTSGLVVFASATSLDLICVAEFCVGKTIASLICCKSYRW